jgi:signal peptidase I
MHKRDNTKKSEFRQYLRKVWWFLWEDDSWASWLVNIVLSFLIIKFLVYPGLGFVLNTSHPIVAVVSGSMEHDGSFDDWWSSSAICAQKSCTQGEHYASFGISREEFEDFPYDDGFNIGDIMILYGTRPDDIVVGDVIVFKTSRPDPIIHRVVKVSKKDGLLYFSTKGDHNSASFGFESFIPEDVYVGRAALRLPYLGYIKIWFVKFIQLFQFIV